MSHLEHLYQYFYAHVGRWSAAAPEQDDALRKRHGRLGDAVQAHAAEHGARLRQTIVDRK